MSTFVSSVALFCLGGRYGSDQVVDINRIRWSTSLGTSGRYHRNTHTLNGDPYILHRDKMYQCTGTHRIKFIDYGAKSPRRATRNDLEKLIRVADALPGIISVSPCVTPIDVEVGPVELIELKILFQNTGKHIYNSPTTADKARRTLEIAEILSAESLFEKPTVTIRDGPHSPLTLSDDVAPWNWRS